MKAEQPEQPETANEQAGADDPWERVAHPDDPTGQRLVRKQNVAVGGTFKAADDFDREAPVRSNPNPLRDRAR